MDLLTSMITIDINPIIFNIGHLALRWYGLIIMLAIVIGVWLAAREAERKGFRKSEIYDAAYWVAPGGIPGAMVPQLGVYYTPMPVYELVGNLVIFGLVWQLRKRKLSDGALFVIYLTLYSFERFLLGYTSAFKTVIFGFNQSQLISLAVLIAIVLFFAGRYVLKSKPLQIK